MWRCPFCGYEIEELPQKGSVKCPHCANRILIKKRTKVVRVEAI